MPDRTDILDGPRGRGLCLHLLNAPELDRLTQAADAVSARPGSFSTLAVSAPRGPAHWVDRWRMRRELREARRPPEMPSASEFARTIESAVIAAGPGWAPDPVAVLEALHRTVDEAKYWQPPDGHESLAADAASREALEPVARAVGDVLAWWPWAHEDEVASVAFDNHRTAPSPAASVPPGETLARWREEADRRERGAWWSTPPYELLTTSAVSPAWGPLGLYVQEDGLGDEGAVVTPRERPKEARVFVVDAPGDWADLCRAFPHPVSTERPHEWVEVTGRSGAWVMPAWDEVAQEWDAVHVSVKGYLSTATRAVDVDEERASVLAGWNPGQTFWLTSRPAASGKRVLWRHSEQLGWRPLS